MPGQLVLLLLLVVAAAGCARRVETPAVTTTGEPVTLRGCDDGGDQGGVLIDGVCL